MVGDRQGMGDGRQAISTRPREAQAATMQARCRQDGAGYTTMTDRNHSNALRINGLHASGRCRVADPPPKISEGGEKNKYIPLIPPLLLHTPSTSSTP